MSTSSPQRRSRRREVSDVIEEDGPSQRRTQGEEIEEDDEDVRLPRRVKKGRKTKPRTAARADADGGEDVGAPDDGEDPLANFGEQPLDKNQSGRIGGLSSDWKQVRVGTHVKWYSMMNDVAASIAEFMEGEKLEQNMNGMEKKMKELLDTESQLNAHEDALEELQQRVARGEAIIDVVGAYEEGVRRRQQERQQKTTRQKYGKSEAYAEFRQAIFEVQNPNEAMPPITDFIPKEPGDDSDEEEIEVGGITQDYKCPLTLTILVDPLTSKVCGHSFSAMAIREYLGNEPVARKVCPTAGCNKVISSADLKDNKDLKRKAENAARRERMREAEDDDDDDDDVVE